MEQATTISVTPIQAILVVIFQLWLLVFPMLILWKVEKLTRLIETAMKDEEGTTKEEHVEEI